MRLLDKGGKGRRYSNLDTWYRGYLSKSSSSSSVLALVGLAAIAGVECHLQQDEVILQCHYSAVPLQGVVHNATAEWYDPAPSCSVPAD